VKYRTIVADPPWEYGEGFVSYPGTRLRRNALGKQGGQRRVSKPLPYESLSLDEIRLLPVLDLAEPDCALWLWTTSRYLPASFEVIAAWGFSYRQTLVWHKVRAVPALGGSVAPNHAEFLLLAKRGSPKMGRLPSSVIEACGNSGGAPKHSRKPDGFLDRIELVSPAPHIELFARRQRLGWDTWGNEALNHVEITA
jgi:N6-adenosine-specific RNA methylase IME4